MYRGPFCGEEAASWALVARDRCRDPFVQCVTGLGGYWEQRGEYDRATAVYERALQAHDSAEPFYQGLIRCALAANDTTSALSAYRRCRTTLTSSLGIQPSPQTRQLVNPLLTGL